MILAKGSYLKNLGNKVNKPNTSQKLYWKIIQRVMNKTRAPKLPPPLVNGVFNMISKAKQSISMSFFISMQTHH